MNPPRRKRSLILLLLVAACGGCARGRAWPGWMAEPTPRPIPAEQQGTLVSYPLRARSPVDPSPVDPSPVGRGSILGDENADCGSPVSGKSGIAARNVSFLKPAKKRAHGQTADGLNADQPQDRDAIEDLLQDFDRDSPTTVAERLPGPQRDVLTQNPESSPGPRNASSTPSNFRDLSESEMLRIALESSPVLRPLGVRVIDNPDAAITLFDPAIDATDPFFGPAAALAQFDSVLSSSLIAQNNDRVFNNRTLGGQVQELTQDFVSSNASLQRRTRSGGIYQLGIAHQYDNNNRNANLFPNYYETQWEASLRQPLLRGGGRDFNLIAGPNAQPGFRFSNGILLAQLSNQISDADFAIAVRDSTADLYRVYWQLHRNYLQYAATSAAAEVAYQTWQTVLARRQSQVAGGEASKEAQARADYYNYRRQVQTTLGGSEAGGGGGGGLYANERELRRLMGLPVVDGQLLRPTDSAPAAAFHFDYDQLVARGLGGRTEVRRQSLRVRDGELRLVASKNFLLPQLDAIGRYRLRGFGDDLTGDGSARFASAYKDFFSGDHQEWEFGVEMGVVAGRRQARAAIRNAQLQLHRERAILHQVEREIRQDVAAADAEVKSAFSTLETSRLQVEAARERLDSSIALYDAGSLRIEFLLDAQAELLQAQLLLAADNARYALSLIGVGTATGTLLSDIGISLQLSDCGLSGVRY